MKTFAQKLLAEIKRLDMNDREIGELLDVSRMTVRHWKAGTHAPGSIAAAAYLAALERIQPPAKATDRPK